MLDVRRMQVLRAVVSSGSMTAAAEQLGYTPSAVSQQVAVLEREAGIALLERFGRGVRPTAAGRLLTGYTDVISRHLAEAETALADLRAERSGRLAVRYFTSVGSTLVAPAVARVRREHPGVRIDLRLGEQQDPLAEVERGDADVAVVVRPDGRGRPGVRLIPLIDDPFHAVLPAGHPLAARRALALADLAAEPWIGSEPPGPCLDIMTDACAAAGFTPNVVAASEDYASAIGFVAAGLGVGLVPRLALGGRHPGVAVRRLHRPQPVRSVYLAVQEAAAAQPALRTLLDALHEAAAARGRETPTRAVRAGTRPDTVRR
ncbi:LysR family transcriptional regulator [Kitasatospora sp. NPDC094028]